MTKILGMYTCKRTILLACDPMKKEHVNPPLKYLMSKMWVAAAAGAWMSLLGSWRKTLKSHTIA